MEELSVVTPGQYMVVVASSSRAGLVDLSFARNGSGSARRIPIAMGWCPSGIVLAPRHWTERGMGCSSLARSLITMGGTSSVGHHPLRLPPTGTGTYVSLISGLLKVSVGRLAPTYLLELFNIQGRAPLALGLEAFPLDGRILVLQRLL